MDSPLSDDPNGEHYDINALINEHVRKTIVSIQFYDLIFRIH